MADCTSREGTDADVKEAHDLDHFEAVVLVRIWGPWFDTMPMPCFILGWRVICGES